jgi:hypothetical protein
MEDFKIVQKEVIGNVTIKKNTQFNNINAENVLISKNIIARLFGTVTNVILKEGSKLYLHGIINGNVQNEGGEILVFNQ